MSKSITAMSPSVVTVQRHKPQFIRRSVCPLYVWCHLLSHVELKGEDPQEIERGYALMSEEHPPNDLIGYARMAEEAVFGFATISDHYHPWIDAQGHSPFVWGTLGGVAVATEKLRVGTFVTCPTMRINPAIVAQAAATTGAMMQDRFFLGVGTGENLNEHILGSI